MEIKIITSVIAVIVTAILCWFLIRRINKINKMLAKWRAFLQDGVEVEGTIANFHCSLKEDYNRGGVASSVATGTLCFVTKDGEKITKDWRGYDVYPSEWKCIDKKEVFETKIPVKIVYNKNNVNDNVVKEELVGFISRFKEKKITLWFCVVGVCVICFLFVAYRGY